MSVTEVKFTGASVGGSATGDDKGEVSLSYRTSYRAKCSDMADTPVTVLRFFETHTSLGGVSLPYPGRSYKFGNGFDGLAKCKTVSPDLIENSGGVYNVTATFDSGSEEEEEEKGKDEKGKPTKDPDKFHDEISVSYSQTSIPVYRATFRKFLDAKKTHPSFKADQLMALQASNCKPFDPTLDEEIGITILRFTTNNLRYRGDDLKQYNGAINSDTVTITKPEYAGFSHKITPYHGLFRVVGNDFAIATLGKNNIVKYFRQTCEIQVVDVTHGYGWRRLVLDQGIDELWKPEDVHPRLDVLSNSDAIFDGQPFFREPIKDHEGYPISTPVPLDGNGHQINPQKDKPVYGVWSTKQEMAFAGLKGLAW